jgi:hypothetical protein
MSWRAWCKGGAVFTSWDNDPADVTDEVLYVMEYKTDGRRVIHTGQQSSLAIDVWYVFSPCCCVMYEGPRSESPHKGVHKLGVYASDEEYNTVSDKALTMNEDGTKRTVRVKTPTGCC